MMGKQPGRQPMGRLICVPHGCYMGPRLAAAAPAGKKPRGYLHQAGQPGLQKHEGGRQTTVSR